MIWWLMVEIRKDHRLHHKNFSQSFHSNTKLNKRFQLFVGTTIFNAFLFLLEGNLLSFRPMITIFITRLCTENTPSKGCWLHSKFLQLILVDLKRGSYIMPRCSMYGIFTYIYHKFKPHLAKFHTWSIWDGQCRNPQARNRRSVHNSSI